MANTELQSARAVLAYKLTDFLESLGHWRALRDQEAGRLDDAGAIVQSYDLIREVGRLLESVALEYVLTVADVSDAFSAFERGYSAVSDAQSLTVVGS